MARKPAKIPSPQRLGWTALLDLDENWLRRVWWLLCRIDRKQPVSARRMVRDLDVHPDTACRFLRSQWPSWARYVVDGESSGGTATAMGQGNGTEHPDPRVAQALAAMGPPRGETVGKRGEGDLSPTRKAL